jgi:phosphoglycolate phosphatase-like HAD superfamily hydrolase
MSKVVLFDIDGTLVLTGGAGMRALNRACEEIMGLPEAMTDVPLAGRTDRIILREVTMKAGRELDDALFSALRGTYVRLLPGEIQRPGRGTKAVLPGVRDLLEVLSARDDVFLGLVTGNFEEGARIKLQYFDLWRYFRCGAFGDDDEDRHALVPIALQRAQGCGVDDPDPRQVFVVGDTPNDVSCALAAGAVPVGVATGNYTAEHLKACGAKWVFDDLSDTKAFMALLS